MSNPSDGPPLEHSVTGHSGWLRHIFRSFYGREFRILWMGAFTSTVGTWTQEVAQNWLILTLTGSAFLLGLDAFLGDLPIVLFSLIGGVVADRADRRRLLLASQYLQMIFAFVLAALIYSRKVTVVHILLLSFMTGTSQAFGGPAYQSLIPSLVPKAQLPNAIALNSIQFNLARIIGPLVAGVAFSAFGAAACFLFNGISFVAVIVSLRALKTTFLPSASHQNLLVDLKAGLLFVRHRRSLLSLNLLAFGSTFFGIPLITMLPLFARQVFGMGPRGYSLLLSCSGCGAVLGALTVAALGNSSNKSRTALYLQMFFGLVVVVFSCSRVLWISLSALFLAGIALIAVFALFSSLVQLEAPEQLRGRIMSVYMIAFRGGMPLGSLVTGFLANHIPPAVVLAGNGACLSLIGAISLLYWRRLGFEEAR